MQNDLSSLATTTQDIASDAKKINDAEQQKRLDDVGLNERETGGY